MEPEKLRAGEVLALADRNRAEARAHAVAVGPAGRLVAAGHLRELRHAMKVESRIFEIVMVFFFIAFAQIGLGQEVEQVV